MEQKIKNLIKNYKPSQQAIKIVEQNTIILLSGISAAGKDTIKNELLKTNDFYHLVSHTTRNKRQNDGVWEQDGIEYNFIDLNEAQRMLENYEFIEAKFVHGNVYGTSVEQFSKANALQKMPVTDIDIAGVDEYHNITKNMFAIFILPPNFNIWIERFKERYSSEEEFYNEFPKRLKTAKKELEFVLSQKYFYYVINDELNIAVDHVRQIIHGQKEDYSQEKQVAEELLAKITKELEKYEF